MSIKCWPSVGESPLWANQRASRARRRFELGRCPRPADFHRTRRGSAKFGPSWVRLGPGSTKSGRLRPSSACGCSTAFDLTSAPLVWSCPDSARIRPGLGDFGEFGAIWAQSGAGSADFMQLELILVPMPVNCGPVLTKCTRGRSKLTRLGRGDSRVLIVFRGPPLSAHVDRYRQITPSIYPLIGLSVCVHGDADRA